MKLHTPYYNSSPTITASGVTLAGNFGSSSFINGLFPEFPIIITFFVAKISFVTSVSLNTSIVI